MHVACNLSAVDHHGLVYELLVLRLPRVENLLDDVIAIDLEREQHEIAQKVVLQQSFVL